MELATFQLQRRIGERPGVYALKVAALAAVYYGAAKLGLSLAFMNSSISAVWPPTGIALAALIFWGYRMWPAVLVGAFLANSWTGVPVYGIAGIAIGNTCEALGGAFLLRRVADFRPSLERVRDVVALALLAGIISTTIAATLGVGSLLVADKVNWNDAWSAWRTWCLGDLGGDFIVAPAIMVAITHWPYRRAPGRAFEAVAAAQRIEDAARYISETLQRGLLPLNLPQIPGVETAVQSRPAAEGDLVSGDFYDW